MSSDATKNPDDRSSTFGALAIALVGAALLIDAAIETVWAGSAVRWWAVSVAALYLAGGVVMWRMRVSWQQQLGAIGLAVFGLLAATAWRPGGLTDGVRLLRQPTAIVLSGATVVALLVAAIVLLRASAIPLAARVVAALLAIYGLAAFAFGAWQATTYPSLFNGASLWQAAPRWLQGSVVGGIVALPLAFLVSLARGLRRGEQAWRPQQILALGLAILMVASGFTNSAGLYQSTITVASAVALAARSSVATNPADAGARPSPPEQLRNELEQAFRAVEAFAAAVPADTFDPQAVLAKTGRDPAAIFHWVRDRTVWVPYRGVLRGPVGVLMDRTGNDLDRALLLAQLLKLAGKQVRLARGRLSDAQAEDVLRVARPRPMEQSLSAPELSPEVKALLDQYAKDNPTDAVNVRKFADELLQGDARMEREAGERSAIQARAVAAAVFPASRGRAAPGPADLEPLREHWWVQSLEGSDWTDFDPTMPQSEPGRPLTNAQSTAAPEALDSALYHEVEIRVITERWEQGRLEQTPILTHVLRPSELYGLDVSLSHLPIAWPKDFNTVHMTDLPKRLKAIGLSQHEWLPVLQVGSNLIFQSSFTDAGIKRTARPGPLGGTGTGIERGIEGVSALFGSAGDQAKHSVLTAEWIEYEIRSPAQPARKIRRQLFDLIGPAQRTAAAAAEPTVTDRLHRNLALALLGKTDILILGCQPSRDFVGHLFAQRLLDDRQPLLNLVSTAPREEETLQGMLANVTPVPSPLYGLAMARSRWSRYHNDVYTDRPIILSAHQQIREGPDGDLAGAYSFDIVANDVAVRTDSKIDAPLVRLEQGVRDTAAEWLLASAFLETGEDGQTTSSVSEIFRLARGQGVDWFAIRSVDDPAWQRIQLGADARARINQDLAAGYIVVVPNRPVMLNGHTRVGWWLVDPKSGQSLGVDDMGWGATIVEYMHIVANLESAALCFYKAKQMKNKTTGDAVATACVIGASFALLGPATSSLVTLCAKVCFLLAGVGAL